MPRACLTLLDQSLKQKGLLPAESPSRSTEAPTEKDALCRKTNTQNAEMAKKSWTEGRKYTLTLVQPNGEQLGLIARYMEQVGFHSFCMRSKYL